MRETCHEQVGEHERDMPEQVGKHQRETCHEQVGEHERDMSRAGW